MSNMQAEDEMKRPIESDYTSAVAYTRSLEAYCDYIEKRKPDYTWPTVADYEKDMEFEVNQPFKMAWSMARTTNSMFTQKEKNT